MLGGLKQQLSTTAAALAALHGSGVSYGPTATLEEEIGEVEEVVDRLALSVPELAAAARPLLRELTARSGAEPPDPVVPAHHTFRPAQVLLTDQGVGFIDFDSACMAEPAVDLGRFRASLRDIGISTLDLGDSPPSAAQLETRLGLLDELCEHVLVAYQQHAVVSRERVLLWESCELMTTLLHAWTKVRLSRVLPRLALLTHQLRSGALDAHTGGVSS
jgi:aminoglycoside phosphotransferase (APT) family kinase protein